MSEISVRQAVSAFVVVFLVLSLVLQPIHPLLVQIVSLPEPTLWQSAAMFVGQLIIAGLAVYASNQRQRIRTLECEVERMKYRRQNRGIEQ